MLEAAVRQRESPETRTPARVRSCRTADARFTAARAHAGEPRAQQAGKMETRPLLAASEGGTVAATLEIHHGVVAFQSNSGPWRALK